MPTDGQPPFTRAACLAELLKTMFNLQSFTGSDHNSPSPVFDLATMHAVARIVSELPIPSSPPMSPPLSHAVHVLMCGPPKGWCTPALARILCSQVLELELATHVFPESPSPGVGPYTAKMAAASSATMTNNNDYAQSAGDRLSPLLHLLAHVYLAEAKRDDGNQSSSQVCEVLKALLVPKDLDRQVSIEHGRTLGHFVIRLLTYVESSALREAAEVLVFALCDNNGCAASTMVAHTGLGPSAGFLVNRGLLTEDILKAAGHDPKVNPITGQKEDEQADLKAEWEKMTDEEKEAEAEKLFVQFERLNKLGIIKAVDPTTGREIGR
ncbi:guanine nucleotide exchange factor [Catenaria anguillulae PL171]|uniref:Guanine nucleotide exchange factor n=1 Tax=Catenaria anguillulae PL171 TaxID=765915 RepID=A0A1Y2HAV9_9FUNG|nr:guanine nucleotide exchange factor [Catenaria anguillulae PL171]